MWGQITGISSTAPRTFSNGNSIEKIFPTLYVADGNLPGPAVVRLVSVDLGRRLPNSYNYKVVLLQVLFFFIATKPTLTILS